MKVSMLVHNPPYQGGIVQYSVLLCNSMEGMVDFNLVGFKSLYPPLLYKGKLPKENRSGINFKSISDNFVTWYNPLTWIKAYLRMKKSDIIHMHWVSPLLTPLQYTILILNKLFSKKKIVLTCHNIESHETTFIDSMFTKMVFSKIDHFIVHADQNKVRLITDYKIHENQVHVVPHGTFGYFTKWKNESKEELRKEFDIKDEKVILFFGYIREYKGLKYLLKALSEVIKDNPKIKLIVAGELWQDWSEYEDIIKKNNLKDHVQIFPNYINDKEVHKFFDLADIVVLPYYNSEQTISGPLLVSLAFGKPTIVSPVGGIKQFVNDEKEVIFSEPGNVDELSNNIKRLLKDNELQKRLSDNALIADKNHQWNAVANHTVELYKKIMRD